MKKIAVIFGTRPEAIKLAPIILALKNDTPLLCKVYVTAQHREMLDQVLDIFGIKTDFDLNLMRPNQSLSDLAARIIQALDTLYAAEQPDLVLVQGDTTTTFCAALSAFYRHIPVGHVEAGLRTGNYFAPWPEEANRVMATRLASLHFTPTEASRRNLLRENIPEDNIHVTGNTVIDALLIALKKTKESSPSIIELPKDLQPSEKSNGIRIVLITGHRRESFGQGFENMCRAIAVLAERYPDIHFVYPVHLNPNVREPVSRILGKAGRLSQNIHLIQPLSYLSFVALMNRSYLILTDSGGVQEEAPSLGIPVLVMRDVTERPEAVLSGSARLVGTDYENIINTATEIIEDHSIYEAMSCASSPYGDGKAAERIVKICEDYLSARIFGNGKP